LLCLGSQKEPDICFNNRAGLHESNSVLIFYFITPSPRSCAYSFYLFNRQYSSGSIGRWQNEIFAEHGVAKLMSSLLSLAGIHWQVDNKPILDNISLDVDKGEVIGIIGPNGAGKTSLLRCILQQQKQTSGCIYFKSKNISQYSSKELAKYFAMVAQKAAPIFALTLYDVVRMGLLPHKTAFSLDNDHDRHQIRLALEKVGLSGDIDTAFNLLSGGEQQRALIARALVQQAEILILDEPTNHLDVYYQHQILQLVKALKITVIMTVHDLNLAAQYCQRLLLLDKGKLVCDNTPDKVLQPEILSRVFNLDCQRDQDPVTGAPRVYFHLAEHADDNA